MASLALPSPVTGTVPLSVCFVCSLPVSRSAAVSVLGLSVVPSWLVVVLLPFVTPLLRLIVNEPSSQTRVCTVRVLHGGFSATCGSRRPPGGLERTPADEGWGGRILTGPAEWPLGCPLPCLWASVHVLMMTACAHTQDSWWPVSDVLRLQVPRPAPRPRAAKAASVALVNRPGKCVTLCHVPLGSGPDNVIMSDRF